MPYLTSSTLSTSSVSFFFLQKTRLLWKVCYGSMATDLTIQPKALGYLHGEPSHRLLWIARSFSVCENTTSYFRSLKMSSYASPVGPSSGWYDTLTIPALPCQNIVSGNHSTECFYLSSLHPPWGKYKWGLNHSIPSSPTWAISLVMEFWKSQHRKISEFPRDWGVCLYTSGYREKGKVVTAHWFW